MRSGIRRLMNIILINFNLLINQMKKIPFKQNNELLNPASFRQGLPESRSQGRDAAHHPWILDPGNPSRDDDVFLTYRYGCVSFSSVSVVIKEKRPCTGI